MHTIAETIKRIIWENFNIFFFITFSIFLLKRPKIQSVVNKKLAWSQQDETVNAGDGTNPITHLCEQ